MSRFIRFVLKDRHYIDDEFSLTFHVIYMVYDGLA